MNGRIRRAGPLHAADQRAFRNRSTVHAGTGGASISTTAAFQPADMAGLTAAQVPRLRLKWAYAFPGASVSFAPPTIMGGLLFIGGTDRKVHALDERKRLRAVDVRDRCGGARRDHGRTASRLRSVRDLLRRFACQRLCRERADGGVDLEDEGRGASGRAHHRRAGAAFRRARRAGVLARGAAGSQASYERRTFRGSVVALEAATGKPVWQAYTIRKCRIRPTRTRRASRLFGPSGAAIWSAPTIDVKRGAIYVATSNSIRIRHPRRVTRFSPSILRRESCSGTQQATPKDAYVVACYGVDKTNCPEDHGPDHDFGQSPILVTLRDGRRVLAIAQKSGVVHALDPDDGGKILWQTRIGKGGALGGSEWGSAADQDRIYVANSDVRFLRDGTETSRLHARRRPVRPRSRQRDSRDGGASCRLWRSSPMQPRAFGGGEPDPRRRCSPAASAASCVPMPATASCSGSSIPRRITRPSTASPPMVARSTVPDQSLPVECSTRIPATANGAASPATCCWRSRWGRVSATFGGAMIDARCSCGAVALSLAGPSRGRCLSLHGLPAPNRCALRRRRLLRG